MITKQTLKPGDRGSKKLTEHFGDRLICVRYRQDPETGKRFKTAEIMVEDFLTMPSEADQDPQEMLSLEIGYHEIALRDQVKAAGGRWNREGLVWKLPRHRVNSLNLQSRIVKNAN
ncbi:hypothetical protein P3T73_06055 [Kiritimatiellota bacterium B12222]|nr:hypothetical protein P3T73_06055 [Kiritimatiellota bacterium B12222]